MYLSENVRQKFYYLEISLTKIEINGSSICYTSKTSNEWGIEGTKNTSITLIELVNEELDCNMEFLQIVTLSKKSKIFVINLENFLF